MGVGSNATANSVMSELGITPFGFFSITPFGIGICILGTLYFTFIGRKLIPTPAMFLSLPRPIKSPWTRERPLFL